MTQDSEWIEWNGGECPVAPETLVLIKTRSGWVDRIPTEARDWAPNCERGENWWSHVGDYDHKNDIIAYRIAEASKP